MPDLFGDFHFLRPLWLLAGLAATLLFVVIERRSNAMHRWQKVIAPHLLEHLRVRGGRGSWFRPIHLVSLLLLLGAVAMSGPTWEREQTPFTEDLAPLVVAMDLSRSMDAIDVPPTRLERAKQKVRDVLERRRGARTALIVYAGSAHTVLPFTDDPSVLETYVTSLATNVMPVRGKEPTAALDLAESLLERDETPGTILFMTDGIAREQIASFAAHAQRSDDQLMVLAFGTSEGGPIRAGDGRFVTDRSGRRLTATLDRDGLEALASQAGADVVSATVDDQDVERLQRRIQSHLAAVRAEDETARWKDMGWYLTIPIALLGLLWFRRGWTVQWSPAVLLLLIAGCASGGNGNAGSFKPIDLFLTPDQQGRLAYERGDYEEAAALFENPMWRGTALYRAGAWEDAIDAYALGSDAPSYYNLGNVYAALERWEDAVAAYDEALVLRPDWERAQRNRTLVAARIPKKPDDASDPSERPEQPNLAPDEIVFDEKGEQGREGEVEVSQLSDEQIAEMWLRNLQTTPADFLRNKFGYQAEMARIERDRTP